MHSTLDSIFYYHKVIFSKAGNNTPKEKPSIAYRKERTTTIVLVLEEPLMFHHQDTRSLVPIEHHKLEQIGENKGKINLFRNEGRVIRIFIVNFEFFKKKKLTSR